MLNYGLDNLIAVQMITEQKNSKIQMKSGTKCCGQCLSRTAPSDFGLPLSSITLSDFGLQFMLCISFMTIAIYVFLSIFTETMQ